MKRESKDITRQYRVRSKRIWECYTRKVEEEDCARRWCFDFSTWIPTNKKVDWNLFLVKQILHCVCLSS